MTDASITPTDNGPYMVEGPLRVVDADGTENELSEQTTIFLCRCGYSSTKPFCDGTHEKANFAAVNRAASRSTPMSLQPSPADKTAGEGEEAFVDVVAAVGAYE